MSVHASVNRVTSRDSNAGSGCSLPRARITAGLPSLPSAITVTLSVTTVERPMRKSISPKLFGSIMRPPWTRASPTGRPPHGS
jgi:hypothetical protein